MRLSRGLALALCAMSALAVLPARAHVTRVATEDYVGGGPAVGLCRQDTGEEINLAAACFDVDPSEDRAVQLRARDVAAPDVAFFYLIHDAGGNCADGTAENCRSSGYVCGDSPSIAIPPLADGIRIVVLDPALGTFGCLFITGDDAVAAAVAGTVTATFSD